MTLGALAAGIAAGVPGAARACAPACAPGAYTAPPMVRAAVDHGAWDQAYARERAAWAMLEAAEGDEAVDRTADAHWAALQALIHDVPAPTWRELVIKIELARERGEIDDCIGAIVADVTRLGEGAAL